MDAARATRASPAWRQIRAELIASARRVHVRDLAAPARARRPGTASVLTLKAPATTGAVDLRALCRAARALRRSPASAPPRASGSPTERGRAMSGPADKDPEPEPGALDFNPRYSFDQFIIGDGNRLAHAAALAVAEHPGQAYNPLFLHAPPGLGKTHLLHAIGNYVLLYGGGATVRYTTVEAFTNHFISALNASEVARRLQARLPRRRRAADRRRPVPRQQGEDRGGVLPHLQRAVRIRPPARRSPATGCRAR